MKEQRQVALPSRSFLLLPSTMPIVLTANDLRISAMSSSSDF
jgi:hypothetical protein